MKSKQSTKEIEQPKVCGCCNIKTWSTIFGISAVICGILFGTNEKLQGSVSFFGTYGYLIYAMIGAIGGGIFLGVGCTDKSECNKAASFFLYALTLLSIGLVVWASWILQDPTKNSGSVYKKYVRNVYDETHKALAEEQKISFEEFFAAVIRAVIFQQTITAIIYFYLATKYGKNAEYLKKKAEKKSATYE